ncbi:hypothetical protein F5B21DRAFT_479287 [Xylaria acuta]|nr:hypothetical protein F5B21DRAFT_479287 [Xylaria acuta]
MGGDRGDASLNTLGYSPMPLDVYLGFIRRIDEEEAKAELNTEIEEAREGKIEKRRKPVIVSVTGTPDQVAECYRRVARCAGEIRIPLTMEINLSCPNIPGKPPPAYEGEALGGYIRRVAEVGAEASKEGKGFAIPWGVKTPPYTHAGQFEMFVSVLRGCAVGFPGSGDRNGDGDGDGDGNERMPICPLSFVTATNTLGSCLLLGGSESILSPVLPGPGIGGLAGAPLHPLALGNVATLRRMLDANPATRHIALLGIGGVADAEGYRRMRSVGAAAVGVGTALGVRGLRVFGEIKDGLGDRGWAI